MPQRVRLLNVDVDDITMDELVETFRRGVMLTLHVDMIMKLQQDREFYRAAPEVRRGDLRQPDPDRGGAIARARPCRSASRARTTFRAFYTRYKDDPSVTVFICGGGPGVAEIARPT